MATIFIGLMKTVVIFLFNIFLSKEKTQQSRVLLKFSASRQNDLSEYHIHLRIILTESALFFIHSIDS